MKKEYVYVPYTKNVEVKEYRAPTDESIRLYREMEEKAEKNIIAKETFIDNELKGTVCYVELSYASFDVRAHIRFSLNGKDYHEIITVPRSFSADKHKSRIILYTSIIEKLAQTFTIELEKINV